MNQCPRCKAHINWASDRCFKCNYDIGVPNQRELQTAEEVDALQQRYQQARQSTQNTVQLSELEQLIQQKSRAIINTSAKLLDDFLSSDTLLISNYSLQVVGETRKVAEMKNDRQRCITESALFGSYANEIRYAALSLDHKGLVSYGSCSVTVDDFTTHYKATVLEENSFAFAAKHPETLVESTPPKGYRATWTQRHLLVIAKLAAKITAKSQNWAELLLKSNGDRQQDEFMEVHIYGAFDKQAITTVAVPKQPKNETERVAVEAICDYAINLNIACVEYDY